jgi:hypothetical protein
VPFITKDRRLAIEDRTLKPDDFEPGDQCYVYYKHLVEAWRADSRWATADRLYRWVLQHNFTVEDAAAAQLAWQVFFTIHVFPYETKQRLQNGDI